MTDDDASPARPIALALVSHTNAGKTTLARTLLARDIGEVRDAPHVTFESEQLLLAQTEQGDALVLWDTPGFGDSLRLARRLRLAGNPIGWFLTEVWDRFRDRAFWSSQRAIRTVVEHADVVLYLLNASESPQDVSYLDAELEVLQLLDRPVIALLNQLGPPGTPEAERAEIERWQARLGQAAVVREVIALDAFARCWVQEGVLLAAVARALPADLAPAFSRLRAQWRSRREGTWHASMAVLAEALARAVLDREPVADLDWSTRLGRMGERMGEKLGEAFGARRPVPPGGDGPARPAPQDAALRVLAGRLQDDLRRSTDRLIALHGLEGRAAGVVLQRLADRLAVTQPLDEKQAGLWGGLVTGALTGLKADLLSGGLTMGGGVLAGSVLGALAGLGVARGVNKARGVERAEVAWRAEVLDDLARAALLIYLAVAHYGRGRGAWTETEVPAAWQQQVDAVVAERADDLRALRTLGEDDAAGLPADAAALSPALQAWLEDRSRVLLARLYPQAPGIGA